MERNLLKPIGEPDAVKVACPVRRGLVGEVLTQGSNSLPYPKGGRENWLPNVKGGCEARPLPPRSGALAGNDFMPGNQGRHSGIRSGGVPERSVPQAQKGFRFGGIFERGAAGAMKASIRFGGVLDGPCRRRTRVLCGWPVPKWPKYNQAFGGDATPQAILTTYFRSTSCGGLHGRCPLSGAGWALPQTRRSLWW